MYACNMDFNMGLRWGAAVADLAMVACGGKTEGAAATGDAAATGSNPDGAVPSPVAAATTDGAIIVDGLDGGATAESEAGPNVLAAEAPDAFPDDCATALPVFAKYASGPPCQLSPSNVACESTNDCVVTLIPLCCGSEAVGVNKDASLVCLPPNGCLPPPPGSGIAPCSPSVATEDCRTVAARQDVGVACVNQQCLTYAVGP
jgi:hypothetical protein